MMRPNLFLVGAPKCGTTAMHRYLSEHPEVHMSAEKEPHYFGLDLRCRFPRRTLDQYLSLFEEAGSARWRGDASVFYLSSHTAAREILAFAPKARIIVMLRNPVDMLYSLHSQLLYTRDEDIEDFTEALAAESDRRRGLRLPRRASWPEAIYYRDIVCYAEQIERYFDAFGRTRVHVILFDDMKRDTADAYRAVLDFLEIDNAFRPSFKVTNSNKRRRRAMALLDLARKPAPHSVARVLLPKNVRIAVRDLLGRLGTLKVCRAPMDASLRSNLADELRPEVERLEILLQRNLSSWRGV